MCGITGIASNFLRPENTKESVEKMCKILHHRGPDNTTISSYKDAVFGHNRLSLIDLNERSNQPFENDKFALVFNGEIYNYLDLKKELIQGYNQNFSTTSDTEVLFFGLIHWGLELTLSKLKGMFAFAFYDFLESKVLLARDRTGMKPLFYSTKFSKLTFSSEIKGMWCLDEFRCLNDKFLNLAAFGEYEYSRIITALTDVKQLEPGTFLTYDIPSGKSKVEFYFKMSDYVSEEKFLKREKQKESEVFSEFEELFTGTVHSVMAADAKMGAFVSGGVDSSLCAGIAFQKSPVSLFTSNVVGKNSELENSSYLAKLLNAELNKHDFTPDLFLKYWAKTTWYYESPILSHANAVPFQFVSQLANINSCKAVLTGEGSDELFLGYPRLLTRRLDRMIQFPFSATTNLYKKIPGLSRYLNLDKENFQTDYANLLTGYEFAEKEMKNQEAYGFVKDKSDQHDQAMTLNMLERTIHSLLWRNDRMGMMHSIESRFPFLHEDILEFAINLPVKFKVGRSTKFHNFKHPFLIDKHIVRKLTQKVLNEKLAYIQKKGFPVAGLMNIQVEKDFFKNGFLEETLDLNENSLTMLKRNCPPYMLAKLASVEIWGSLFFSNQSLEEVEDRIMSHIKMVS